MRSARALRSLSSAALIVGLIGVLACSSDPHSSEIPVTNRIVIGAATPPAQVAGGDGARREPSPDPELAVATDPEPPPEPIAEPSGPPIPPLDPGVRDSRAGRLHPRSIQLLVVELQGIEALFASTPKSSPDRPRLIRRLAEGYGELEAASERDLVDATVHRAPSERFIKIRDACRRNIIKFYSLLRTEFPTFCETPPQSVKAGMDTGCPDEVLYYMAYEYELSRRFDLARKVYFELIKNFPDSRFVAHAFFAFGEAFLEEARSDQTKWPIAAQAFVKVTQMKDSPLAPYAAARIQLICERAGNVQISPGLCASQGRGRPQGRGDSGDD